MNVVPASRSSPVSTYFDVMAWSWEHNRCVGAYELLFCRSRPCTL